MKHALSIVAGLCVGLALGYVLRPGDVEDGRYCVSTDGYDANGVIVWHTEGQGRYRGDRAVYHVEHWSDGTVVIPTHGEFYGLLAAPERVKIKAMMKKDGTISIDENAGYWAEPEDDVIEIGKTYDPNDPIYKFIPPAPPDWVEKFGDSERTRLMHSISELRVVVAQLGRRVIVLEDPNEVTE